MFQVTDEITSQPQCWSRAAELATEASTARTLPAAGARVAVIGCGTSLYMAQSFAALREGLGQGETDAFAASEFASQRGYDHVVALTRSGTTTEVIRALDSLPAGRRSTVITTATDLPVVAAADDVVVLDFADERSVVQTRFATTSLALWRAHLGTDLTVVIEEAEQQVAVRPAADIVRRNQFTFLGTGWTVGLANEAALKVREAAQMWTESYPAMEFRHGPISVIDEDSVVWIFGVAPDGLTDDLSPTGGAVVHSGIDPMAHLVGAQRLAVALAERRGLDPDAPRNLTRSIILSSA